MGKNIQFEECFNTKIKHIVYSNDKQVYQDAEKIFSLNGRINNIPVIDNSGKLMFQIDRYLENTNKLHAINNILEAASNGSLEYFLKSGGECREIILTGADEKSLFNAKQIFYQYCSKLISELDIVINIAEDIDKIYVSGKNVSIISLNLFGFMYLWNIKNIRADIITAHELVSFSELKTINDFDAEIINTFMDIFKYNTILFYPLNANVVLIKDILNNYGIESYDIKDFSNNKRFIKNTENSALNLYLVSGVSGNEYIEKININELLIFLKYIKRYKQLSGEALSYNKFMQNCVLYIKDLYDKEFHGFLQSVDSLWEKEFHDNIKKECNIEIINVWEDLKPGIKYIIDKKNLRKPLSGSLVSPMKKQFLMYVCEYLLYNIIKKKCYNVYICSRLFSIDNILYNDRNRGNFLINKELFVENFVNDICGGGMRIISHR